MGRNETKKMKMCAAFIVFALAMGGVSGGARAQCESAASANAQLSVLIDRDIDLINRFIIQEKNFIDLIMANNAGISLAMARLGQFIRHVQTWLNPRWQEVLNGLRSMTAELHVGQVDQTRALGAFVDAQLMVEEENRSRLLKLEARRRYAPSVLACEIDTLGPGLSNVFRISQALSRTLALDDKPRRGNDVNSVSANGTNAEVSAAWNEYVARFCDNAMGDLGCTAPGTHPGKNRDIPSLLWGSRQTIDLSSPDNLLMVQAALRYMIYPLAADPILTGAVDTEEGHIGILNRRADAAYLGAIYNTMGSMISERAGGSGVNVRQMLTDAGLPAADASTNASYRELQELLTRDRYHNMQYIIRMIEHPVQMNRQQTTINASRLQTMNDLYRRSEELLFLSAAEYSRDLYLQTPEQPSQAAPLIFGP